MDAESFKKLLDRDHSMDQNREKIEKETHALRMLVDYASRAFIRCWQDRPDTSRKHYSLFLLHRHIMEMTDGVEQLTAGSCFGAAIPCVRSCFEAQLFMDFITENDYDARSLAWLNDFIHKMLGESELLDPTTPKGKDLLGSIKSDKFIRVIPPEMITDYEKEAPQLLDLLRGKELAKLEEKREQLRQSGTQKLQFWCQLCSGCDGIAGLRHLADHLKRPAEYRLMYRKWSEVSHARNTARFFTDVEDGKQFLRPMRSPEGSEGTAQSAAFYLSEATTILFQKFRPDELPSYKRWFDAEIAGKLTA